jgi:hypothetical protein
MQFARLFDAFDSIEIVSTIVENFDFLDLWEFVVISSKSWSKGMDWQHHFIFSLKNEKLSKP